MHGPLGIGKSTLLDVFRAMCADAGVPSYSIDAQAVACSPTAINRGVLEAIGASSPAGLWNVIPVLARARWVLFVDGFERWQPLAEHFLRVTVASLPSTALVVIAGRVAPTSRWGWDWTRNALVHSLDVLPPPDAVEALALRGIPPEARPHLARKTAGHPFCIAIRAAEHLGSDRTRVDSPILTTLGTMSDVGARVEREALEIAALSSRITEDMLATVLGDVGAAAGAYRMLQTICTVAPTGNGLRMPGVLREAISTDLRRRNPSRYAEIRGSLVKFLGECIESGHPGRSAECFTDFIDTFADHPVLQLLSNANAGDVLVDPAPAFERTDVEAFVRKKVKDPAALALVLQRIARFPECLHAARDGNGHILGLMQAMVVPTDKLVRQTFANDPVLAGFGEALRSRPGLHPSQILVVPFSALGPSLDGGVGALTLAFARMFIRTRTIQAAFAFLPADHPLVRALRFLPPCRQEVVVGGIRHVLVGCDFTQTSRSALLERLLAYERETPGCQEESAPALDPESFSEEVRTCLPNLSLPVRLAESPLVHSMLVDAEVGESAGVEQRAAMLGRVVVRSIEGLSRQDEKAHRVLHATFVARLGTHEEIAEDLDLSYSTFRRQLSRATELLVRTLLIQETDLQRNRAQTSQRQLSAGGS